MTVDSATRRMDLPSFIVFSDDWGQHPSSCQHIFRHIAARHRVIWVNTVGMRSPKLTSRDISKAWRKLRGMLRGAPAGEYRCSAPVGLTVCQPAMLPFSGIAGVRRLNRMSVLRSVRRLTLALDIRNPIVVTTVPNACDYVSDLGAAAVVYYCVDDFTQWPGLDHSVVRQMEQDLLQNSDILIATSRRLLDGFREQGRHAELLSHGVDLALFSAEPVREHPCLESIPRPRFGYFGLFDERTNQDLLSRLAARMPHCSFVITGPVATEQAALGDHPNVFFTGSIEYADLPSLVKGLDALFIPYHVNDFTASISPLKLNEYLLTGLPVVTTPMAEAVRRGGEISIAATLDEWQDALQSSIGLDSQERRRKMRIALAGESWASKADEFLRMCTEPRGAGNVRPAV